MSDYIKREDAVQSIVEHDITKDESSKEWAIWLLENAKPADVEPVRHGRWEDGNGNLMSWGCHYTFCTNCNEESEYMDRFCGNCGAKMIALGERFDAKEQKWKEVECEMDEDGTGMDGEEE